MVLEVIAQFMIFKLFDELQRERNSEMHSSVAYLDLLKAFNCVNHDIFFKKIETLWFC